MKKTAQVLSAAVLFLAASAWAQSRDQEVNFDGASGISASDLAQAAKAAAQKMPSPIPYPVRPKARVVSVTAGPRPDGKGIGTIASHHFFGASHTGASGNGIDYHGGPLILGGVDVYYIWYGHWTGWDGTAAKNVLTNLATHLGGSPYFNINTTYYNGAGVAVANRVTYKGSTTDLYSHKTALSDLDVKEIVARALAKGALPMDSHGVYFVLTSSDVTATSGFCTQYCGWHDHGKIAGQDVKFAFIGDPDQCPSACNAQTGTLTGSTAADGMASVISHELEEATTDPDLNAWYSFKAGENADMCAWTFGAEKTAYGNVVYNMTLGSYNYLIQQNWVNAKGGYCAQNYQAPAAPPAVASSR